jgi:hypothetical protein
MLTMEMPYGTDDSLALPRSTGRRRRAECAAALRETALASVNTIVQDVIHDHAPAIPGYTAGTANNLFSTSDAAALCLTDDERGVLGEVLESAREKGAIRSTGKGTWIVTNEELLYG